MLKRYVIAGFSATTLLLSAPTFAADAATGMIGTVNMQQILQTAPQVKKINDQLQSQFAKRKSDILAQAKILQSDMSNYDKNKTVLDVKKANDLKAKIDSEENQLRSGQMSYQQDLMAAQNTAMNGFLKNLKVSVAAVAVQKNLVAVLPENTLLYAAPSTDVTNAVLANLQGSK